jgi:hypothetical protein
MFTCFALLSCSSPSRDAINSVKESVVDMLPTHAKLAYARSFKKKEDRILELLPIPNLEDFFEHLNHSLLFLQSNNRFTGQASFLLLASENFSDRFPGYVELAIQYISSTQAEFYRDLASFKLPESISYQRTVFPELFSIKKIIKFFYTKQHELKPKLEASISSEKISQLETNINYLKFYSSCFIEELRFFIEIVDPDFVYSTDMILTSDRDTIFDRIVFAIGAEVLKDDKKAVESPEGVDISNLKDDKLDYHEFYADRLCLPQYPVSIVKHIYLYNQRKLTYKYAEYKKLAAIWDVYIKWGSDEEKLAHREFKEVLNGAFVKI